MKKSPLLPLLYLFVLISLFNSNIVYADSTLLTPAENLWLKSRNNTIVVYPTKNFPPFSYENSAGNPQGLSMDYIELIAQKIGAKVEYLQARPLSQVLDDIKSGKGDIITSLTDTKEREEFLYFTDNYVTVSAVIVVRKDYEKDDIKNLNDLTGKKVAIAEGHAVEDFVRKNNPRAVIESMTDDEISLQQVVLGEVDAAIMDVASLSYYLSKQVLSSVKIAGNVGFEYKPSFAVKKDKQILQGILDKGLQQISINDRQIFNDKWIVVPGESNKNSSWFDKIQNFLGVGTIYILFTLGVGAIVYFLLKKRQPGFSYRHKRDSINELKDEISELEDTSRGLVDELESVKHLEEDIKDKLKKIDHL